VPVAESHLAFAAGEDAAQPNEAARHQRLADQRAVALFPQRRRVHARADLDRQDQQAVGAQLLDPGGQHIGRPDGQDDPIVGRVRRMAVAAIAEDDQDIIESGHREVCPRALHDVVVHVDRRHPATRPDEIAQQRRVVAGAGTYLQHSLPRLQQ
jgi:hypothetical protein